MAAPRADDAADAMGIWARGLASGGWSEAIAGSFACGMGLRVGVNERRASQGTGLSLRLRANLSARCAQVRGRRRARENGEGVSGDGSVVPAS
jgi:hypothetical protein